MSFFSKRPSIDKFNALTDRVAALEAKLAPERAGLKTWWGRVYFGMPGEPGFGSWMLPPEATITEPCVLLGPDGFYFFPMWRTGYDPSVEVQFGPIFADAKQGSSWTGGGGDPKILPPRFARCWQGWREGKAGLFLSVHNADGTLGADFRYDVDITFLTP